MATARKDRQFEARGARISAPRPEALVTAAPVVDPGALAPLPLIDRALEAAEVRDLAVLLGSLVGDQPDAAGPGVDLAGAVRGDAAARSVAELLGTGHRAGVGRAGEGALG